MNVLDRVYSSNLSQEHFNVHLKDLIVQGWVNVSYSAQELYAFQWSKLYQLVTVKSTFYPVVDYLLCEVCIMFIDRAWNMVNVHHEYVYSS